MPQIPEYQLFAEEMGPILWKELIEQGVKNPRVAFKNMITQLGYESQYGTTRLAKEQNNYGGVGYNDTTKKYSSYKDKADFAKQYVKLMNSKYKNAIGAKTLTDYAKAIRDIGYYTDTLENYANNLNGMKSFQRAVYNHVTNNPQLYSEGIKITKSGDGNKVMKIDPIEYANVPQYESTWSLRQPTNTIYSLNPADRAPESIDSWNGAQSPSKGPVMPSLQKQMDERQKMYDLFDEYAVSTGKKKLMPRLSDLLQKSKDNYIADILGINNTYEDPGYTVTPLIGYGLQQFADGKLPKYRGGKGDGQRYIKNDDTGGWDRITDDDESNLMADLVVTPYGVRNKFDYESNPNYVTPIQKNEVVRPDDTLWTRQQVEKANNTKTWRSDAADALHTIGEGAMIASTFAAPEVEPLVYPAYQAVKNATLSALTSNIPAMQYIRYPLGKVIYGMDAQFPTLYRKIKSMPTEPVNGTVQISNPGNRFVFSNTKKESPIITNFTYDAPVRKHASGNWDSGFTLAMPGRKTLLGKNVISTEPSDLFTYGDDIKIPLSDVTLISGDQDEIALANQYGYKVATSPKLQKLYQEGDSPGVSFTSNGGRKISLLKQDLSDYAKEIENTTRQLFKSPTKNDVNFMNFVLQPKIKGDVYDPSMLDYLIKNGIGTFGDRIGNAELRSYLLDPDRWRNILYDPATHAEYQFRNQMGIELRNGYKDGKSPIHIKPANRGKLTRLKKRTGKSESELYNDGNPAHKKMVVFARNARKWKH